MRIHEILEAAPTLGKPSGFVSSLGKAFKSGIGMDPNLGLAGNLVSKALDAGGLSRTASGIHQDARTPMGTQGTTTDPQNKLSTVSISPGTMVKDPRLGNVRVLPSAPGSKGVHLDTKKVLGYNIYVDPAELGKQA